MSLKLIACMVATIPHWANGEKSVVRKVPIDANGKEQPAVSESQHEPKAVVRRITSTVEASGNVRLHNKAVVRSAKGEHGAELPPSAMAQTQAATFNPQGILNEQTQSLASVNVALHSLEDRVEKIEKAISHTQAGGWSTSSTMTTCTGSSFEESFSGTEGGLVANSNTMRLHKAYCPKNDGIKVYVEHAVPSQSSSIELAFGVVQIGGSGCSQCHQGDAWTSPLWVNLVDGQNTANLFRWCFNRKSWGDCDETENVSLGQWHTKEFMVSAFETKFSYKPTNMILRVGVYADQRTGTTLIRDVNFKECTYSLHWSGYNGAQHGIVTYKGPDGIAWDDFDTCVNPTTATGTLAASAATFCKTRYNLDLRVLRRKDTQEIIGIGNCCNTDNVVTSSSNSCEASGCTYSVHWSGYNGAQTGIVTYNGPDGIAWDDFDTCVNTSHATGTLAASAATFCKNTYNLDVRVLRRKDTQEIIGVGNCCNTDNVVTSSSNTCEAPQACHYLGEPPCTERNDCTWNAVKGPNYGCKETTPAPQTPAPATPAPATPAPPTLACAVTVYEHWPEGITSDMLTTPPNASPEFKAGITWWNGNFPTGHLETFNVIGSHTINSTSGMLSSVKVTSSGGCCQAKGYKDPDCNEEIENMTAIESNVVYEEALGAGVVAPGMSLKLKWGCNDCTMCVKLEQC